MWQAGASHPAKGVVGLCWLEALRLDGMESCSCSQGNLYDGAELARDANLVGAASRASPGPEVVLP